MWVCFVASLPHLPAPSASLPPCRLLPAPCRLSPANQIYNNTDYLISHNLALLLLKTGPGSEQNPGGVLTRANADFDEYERNWKWEKVSAATDSPAGAAAGGGLVANGSVSNGGTGGLCSIKQDLFRWRHTEAVRLLERALAVHREVCLCVYVCLCACGGVSCLERGRVQYMIHTRTNLMSEG